MTVLAKQMQRERDEARGHKPRRETVEPPDRDRADGVRRSGSRFRRS